MKNILLTITILFILFLVINPIEPSPFKEFSFYKTLWSHEEPKVEYDPINAINNFIEKGK